MIRTFEPMVLAAPFKKVAITGHWLHSWLEFLLQSVEQLNWMGDTSSKGLDASAGLMVNYRYRYGIHTAHSI